MDKETEQGIRELQMMEQNMQNLLMQKQAFQLELSEVENALIELGKTNEDSYKISGNIMIKYSKETLLGDLKQKKELLTIRIKSMDAQEKKFESESENLRKKILPKIKK